MIDFLPYFQSAIFWLQKVLFGAGYYDIYLLPSLPPALMLSPCVSSKPAFATTLCVKSNCHIIPDHNLARVSTLMDAWGNSVGAGFLVCVCVRVCESHPPFFRDWAASKTVLSFQNDIVAWRLWWHSDRYASLQTSAGVSKRRMVFCQQTPSDARGSRRSFNDSDERTHDFKERQNSIPRQDLSMWKQETSIWNLELSIWKREPSIWKQKYFDYTDAVAIAGSYQSFRCWAVNTGHGQARADLAGAHLPSHSEAKYVLERFSFRVERIHYQI